MHGFELLRDLLILLAVGVGAVVALHRLRLPPIVAFLATGVVCGPAGFGLIQNHREIETLAELGVVLLLFTVGLEFSLQQLVRLRWVLLVGGGVQVVGTAAATAIFLRALGWPWARAEFAGMLVALSSTAIVIRLIAERGEVDTPPGRHSLAILIFQDLCVVPMVLVTPYLAGGGGEGSGALALVAAKAAAFLALAALASRYLVPWVLQLAVGTRRREVFLLTVVLLCLGAAWVSAQVGLSLALGAFLAGLILSQSEYGAQALGEIVPFRELFNSLFFISVGLLVEPRAAAAMPGTLAGTAVGIVALKALVAGAVPLLMGQPLRVAAATGLSLAQVGEFSFVLAGLGRQAGLIDVGTHQGFLAASVATMALTPWLHGLGARLYREPGTTWDRRLPWAARGATSAPEEPRDVLRDHVIIVGYGLNGRNLNRVLTRAGISSVAVDVNPSTVTAERRQGVPIFYGDATTPEALEHAGVDRARVLVVAISDPPSTRRVVALARRLNPGLHVIARTRYIEEVGAILALGAQDVIPEEFETSVEIFARVLRAYVVPRDVIERSIREVRGDAYQMLRELGAGASPDPGALRLFEGLEFEALRVEAGSPVEGQSIGKAALRSRTGTTIVALRPESGSLVPNPDAGEVLEEGTVAVVLGTAEQIAAAAEVFRGATSSGEG